ncbi:hypothetical protein [Vulcanisaeta sp. JCM 16161]|uniref:hypothetical protein n=1 Tax=Vulcanisaeta sp. JCM 16161 TaxID=1295372 RepID=UPI00406CBD40
MNGRPLGGDQPRKPAHRHGGPAISDLLSMSSLPLKTTRSALNTAGHRQIRG